MFPAFPEVELFLFRKKVLKDENFEGFFIQGLPGREAINPKTHKIRWFGVM